MATLEQFLANLGVTGFAKPNRFEVVITPPSKKYSQMGSTGMLRHLALVCEGVEIPAQTVATADARINGLPVMPMPYEFSYTNTITLTFKLSRDYRERNMLLAWQDSIYQPGLGFSYYNDYLGTINVKCLDLANETVQEIIFKNCFPTSINDIAFNWSSNNEYLRQIATFSFFMAETKTTSASSSTPGSAGLIGLPAALGNIIPRTSLDR